MSARNGAGCFVASGFFILRTPLLPFCEFTRWTGGPGECVNRARLRTGLRARLGRPDLREALFLASPRLEGALAGWVDTDNGDRDRRLDAVLVSYLSRAAARPTPFGLFAGCTTGTLSDRTALELEAHARWRRHSRLDMDYLWSLAGAVEADPELRRNLMFTPNSSIHDAGDRLHVCVPADGLGRSYHLLAVAKTPYLIDTLERAGPGATLGELAAALVDDDIEFIEADEFVGRLVDRGLLVSAARPGVTGAGALGQTAAALEAAPATRALADGLRRAGSVLSDIDAAGIGVAPHRYQAVAAHLSDLPAPIDPARLVQVDMIKPASGKITLDRRVVADIEAGVRLLHRLAPRPAEADLGDFRRRFEDRYGTREVPLAEALDEETGVGFGPAGSPGGASAPLLAGLAIGAPPTAPGPELFTARDRVILRKLTDALVRGTGEISVEAADAGWPDTGPTPLPDAFAALVTVAAASAKAIDTGSFRVLIHEVTGPSGALLLGRFCSADPVLDGHVRRHLRAEEALNPDRIFAEIVHLPEGRIGNVLCRPVLRDWEIPYLGRAGVAPARQISLADLLVSVRDDRIVLRSGHLGREVVPRLTTAHNYGDGNLAVYRFLCRLQDQDVTSVLAWDWGPLGGEPFLPRVVSGRVVLARARWNLEGAELRRLAEAAGAGDTAAVSAWRAERRVDRYVVLPDADEELALDLDNALCVEALAHHLRGRTAAALVELFPGPDELCVTGAGGARFVHQMVVPFIRSAAPAAKAGPAAPAGGPVVQRRLPPGSDWLYAKLYSGPVTADRLLGGPLTAVVRSALGSGAADDWFFVRYADPEDHLRLRFRGPPDRLLAEVLPGLTAAVESLVADGTVWRFTVDTYERETERYGGPAGLEVAERIFRADSDAALVIAGAYPGDPGADLRWRLALAGVDRLFSDLGLTLDGKRAVARTARDAFREEHQLDARTRSAVAARFRAERPRLETLIGPVGDGPDPGPGPMAAGLAALRRRSLDIAPHAATLRCLAEAGRLTVPIADLAGSFAHLHVNRLLPTAQRSQELVLYEFLDRLYTGLAARRGNA